SVYGTSMERNRGEHKRTSTCQSSNFPYGGHELERTAANTKRALFCLHTAGVTGSIPVPPTNLLKHSARYTHRAFIEWVYSWGSAEFRYCKEMNRSMLTHLQRLEAEAIHIIREVVAEADHPVMLYSVGKDSSVMLHLAQKAFYPAQPPF